MLRVSADSIQRLIQNRPQPETLVLSELEGFNTEALTGLVETLNRDENKGIQFLTLKWCELNDETAAVLANLFHVKTLDVSYNNITDPRVLKDFAKSDRTLIIQANNLKNQKNVISALKAMHASGLVIDAQRNALPAAVVDALRKEPIVDVEEAAILASRTQPTITDFFETDGSGIPGSSSSAILTSLTAPPKRT